MTASETDQQLVARVQKGDARAFDLLVLKYQHRIFGLIGRYVFDADEVQDVAQEAFIKAYRALPRFRGDSAFYTWLYRIATNEALTFLERRKRQRRLFVSPGNDDYVLPEARAELHMDGAYVRERLDQAIAQLPPKQKAVFSLRYFEEKSYQEMSDIFTTSVGALKASYHHAVKKIEAQLSK